MDFSERLLQQSDEHRQRACANTDFELAVYCRESRDVMRRQAARIAALESQLAAQAAAVEVLEDCLEVVSGAAADARMHGDIQGRQQMQDLYNRIAALVTEKEDGK